MIRPRHRPWVVVAVAAMALAIAVGCGPVVPAASPSTASTGSSGLVALPDGRKLELTCTGSGGPVVVLDAGLGNTADVWSSVVPGVEAFATVCRYNRAGLGRSDPRPEPHGAASAAADLHALLAAAKLAPPFVVVGASFGGLVAQLFARTWPGETAGVVLVDGIPPKWNAGLEALLTPAQVAQRHAIPNGEPISNDDLRASDAAVLAAPSFPPVKLVVLRHDRAFPGDAGWPTDKVEALWATLQAGLARLSPQSVLIQVRGTSHRIHQDQPGFVVDTIHAIVDPARWPPVAPTPSVAVAVAFGAGAPTVTAGTIPGTVVYGAVDGLRSAAMDGGRSTLLIANDGLVVGEPSVDAAGRLLVFTRRRVQPAASGPQQRPAAELWVRDIAAGTERRIAPDAQLPTIAPDGSSIAFSREGRTWLVHPDGTGLRDLVEGGCAIWSPDSSRLAMCSRDGEVFLLRPSDGSRQDLPTGHGFNEPTAWLPDGVTLALISGRDGDGEIYLVGVDGSNERRLATAAGDQNAVAATPAGLLVTSSLPDADVSDWFLVDPANGAPQSIPWMRGIQIPIAYRAGG